MNQLIVWRCTLRAGKPTLLAIAIIYTALLPQAAQAGWIQDAAGVWRRATYQQPDYSRYAPTGNPTRLQPISRDGFGYINQMGGGQDNVGNYNNPVSTQDAFGSELRTGTYEAPAQWDENVGIRYRVDNGAIVEQYYQFYP